MYDPDVLTLEARDISLMIGHVFVMMNDEVAQKAS